MRRRLVCLVPGASSASGAAPGTQEVKNKALWWMLVAVLCVGGLEQDQDCTVAPSLQVCSFE